MLDTRHSISTPEGIAVEVTPAGPVVRLYAFMIDLLIRGAVFLALLIPLSMLEKTGVGILLIIMFALEWFYPVFYEVLYAGATPGKKAMGLKVLHDDATPVGWSASLIRNLLRGVDILPGTYAFGLVSVLLHKDFKRLGDIVAGTIVVHTEPTRHRAIELEAAAQPPEYPLTLPEQQAVLGFAERHKRLTEERSDELARLSGALVAKGDDPSGKLLAIAAWITGRRT